MARGHRHKDVQRHAQPQSCLRSQIILRAHVERWSTLCRLLASLGAADPSTGKPRDFFAWLGSVGKGAASSGRLQLFLLTHRSATFAVLWNSCWTDALPPISEYGRTAQAVPVGTCQPWCPGPCALALPGRRRPEAS